jgi:hypothetical protein
MRDSTKIGKREEGRGKKEEGIGNVIYFRKVSEMKPRR